jgi:Zn-dependent protease with chaperone function
LVSCAISDDRSDTARASFTRAERQRIDDGALWSPREKQNEALVVAYGTTLEWLVARTPLPVEEERRRTAAKDNEVLAKFRTSEPPAAARDVLQKLVAALPARKRYKTYQFRLTVIDDAKRDAFTVGSGRVFVDRESLQSSLNDQQSGIDRLAFVIAHELGHLCRGHHRRKLQHQWLQQELQNRAGRGAFKGIGTISKHVYTREDDFQADLFAIHLCRNAGYDLENCLDVLRSAGVRKNALLLQTGPPRQGTPPVQPQIQPRTTGEEFTLARHPSAVHRLRRLRLELDGLVYGEAYGLFEFDPETKMLKRAADGSIGTKTRAVVCVHGMESNLGVYRPLMERFAAQQEIPNLRVLGFQYPHDDSLSRSGSFLRREIERVCAGAKQVDFVCHSAGGLVFRYYAEIEGGEFRRAVFQGTPHYGSDLAKLRPLMEARQFLGDLKLGYDPALERAIRDGRGQVTFDLQPGSLFLRYLNGPQSKTTDSIQVDRDRYAIYRGRALKSTQAFLLKSTLAVARSAMKRSLAKQLSKETALAKSMRAGIDKLKFPAEVTRGDLAVTPESAALEGVKTIHTYPLKHRELPKNAEIMEHLLPWLFNETQP